MIPLQSTLERTWHVRCWVTFECAHPRRGSQRAARSCAALSRQSVTRPPPDADLFFQPSPAAVATAPAAAAAKGVPKIRQVAPNNRRQRYGCHLVCSPRFPPGGLDLSMETSKVPDVQSLSESQPAQACLPGVGPVRPPGGPEGSRPRDLSLPWRYVYLGWMLPRARARLSFPY